MADSKSLALAHEAETEALAIEVADPMIEFESRSKAVAMNIPADMPTQGIFVTLKANGKAFEKGSVLYAILEKSDALIARFDRVGPDGDPIKDEDSEKVTDEFLIGWMIETILGESQMAFFDPEMTFLGFQDGSFKAKKARLEAFEKALKAGANEDEAREMAFAAKPAKRAKRKQRKQRKRPIGFNESLRQLHKQNFRHTQAR